MNDGPISRQAAIDAICNVGNVIAWMSIPEPWKDVEEWSKEKRR